MRLLAKLLVGLPGPWAPSHTAAAVRTVLSNCILSSPLFWRPGLWLLPLMAAGELFQKNPKFTLEDPLLYQFPKLGLSVEQGFAPENVSDVGLLALEWAIPIAARLIEARWAACQECTPGVSTECWSCRVLGNPAPARPSRTPSWHPFGWGLHLPALLASGGP